MEPFDPLTALRATYNELRRVVTEDGRPLHLNRCNDLYVALTALGGADYWERHPVREGAWRIVVRVIEGGA